MSAPDRFTDDLAPYALGALPEADRESLEGHLQTCEDCRRELAELRFAADALPLAAPPVEPPAELKGRIMAVVESEAELLAAAGERADRPPAPAKPERERRRWSRFLRPAPIAAALASVLAVGVLAGYALRGDDQPEPRVLAAQVTPAGSSAELHLDGDEGTLAVRNLPAPPGGKVWQVWTQTGNRAPQPTQALFTTRTGEVIVPGDLEGVDRIMVTAEPHNGSARPTSEPVIVASTA